MVGVLSDAASLYRPKAFGGATILDPWECLAEYNAKLKSAGCDIVVPLCHLYEVQVRLSKICQLTPIDCMSHISKFTCIKLILESRYHQ